jgi:hypothetical protein
LQDLFDQAGMSLPSYLGKKAEEQNAEEQKEDEAKDE